MAATELEDVVANIEIVVRAGRGQSHLDEDSRTALAFIINWLAARLPYKEDLPRGYKMLWSVGKDASGTVRRYHQLLKQADPRSGGGGVWIDTSALAQAQMGDIRIFSNDLATGLLGELIRFLQPPESS